MRRLLIVVLLALAVPCLALGQATSPKAPAQKPAVAAGGQELPEYTPDQRWERAASQATVGFVAMIAANRQAGKSVDDAGRWAAGLFGTGWSKAMTPAAMLRAIRRNLLIWPKAEVQVLETTETVARLRFNRPWVAFFGEKGEAYGVKPDELERVWEVFHQTIASERGLTLEQQREGDLVVWTIRKKVT